MRARAILTIVAVIAVLALLFFFVVKPRQDELKRVEASIEQEENRTIQLQAELDRLRALQDNAPELEARLTEIRQLVPRQDNVANFIFQVQEAANAAGLGFAAIAPELPKPPPEGAALAEVRLTIGATGTYFPIQDFVRRLYRLDRALRIDVLDLTLDESGGETGAGFEVELNITARIFFELPPGTVPGAATTTPTTTPTPAATPAPGTTPAATPTPGG
jgi:Tfp pilus assembly protein PilO